jgi:transcriptional regulator with XRE-family HTH domain
MHPRIAENKANISLDSYHKLLYPNYDLQYMRLGEKLRYLREIEGALRGRKGALTQAEIVRLLKKELRETISQAYLSQIESGARPHLTNSSRLLLAKFYKVHPGYLVDDPEGYQEELMSDVGALEDKLDLWLINGAERFHGDAELCQALLRVARHDDSRMCVVLLGAILDNPGLAERLLQVLEPSPASAAEASPKSRRRPQ